MLESNVLELPTNRQHLLIQLALRLMTSLAARLTHAKRSRDEGRPSC